MNERRCLRVKPQVCRTADGSDYGLMSGICPTINRTLLYMLALGFMATLVISCDSEAVNMDGVQTCTDDSCKPKDSNHNHMLDSYETSEHQGESCRYHVDCDSREGAGDGFCDSFLDYTCSTRCASDNECTDNDTDEFHYICRSDGRCAPDEFVTVWEIPANDKKLILPTRFAQKCDFTIDWGDGTHDSLKCDKPCSDVTIDYTNGGCDASCSDLSHDYSKGGVYTVRIKGTYNGFGWSLFSGIGEIYDMSYADYIKKLREVKAFGPVQLGASAFRYSNNLNKLSDIDIPDGSQLVLVSAFAGSNFNYPIQNWDISSVTLMWSVFHDDPVFDQPIGNWDTSNVTDMQQVFENASLFNQAIGNWNTSKVTKMNYMFRNATSFNQSLAHWDTSNVTEIHDIFYDAAKFDQDISGWNISNVTDDTSEVFTKSGLSETNYCKIQNKWGKGNLGMSYTCE